MAICFRVEERDDLARTFAAYDLYSSLLGGLLGRSLTPDDDLYAAPWAFMPETGGECGFVVLTCRVPWLPSPPRRRLGRHTTSPQRRNSNSRDRDGSETDDESHFERARDMMGERCGPRVPMPYVEMGPERMQDYLLLEEEDVHTFTDDGCYPGRDDATRELEDRAVKVTCAAMGWTVPTDWRRERERERKLLFADVDAAEHDADMTEEAGGSASKRMKISEEPFATLIREGVDHREERKDASSPDDEGCGSRDEPMGRSPDDPYAVLIPSPNNPRRGAPIRPEDESMRERSPLERSVDRRHHDAFYGDGVANDANVIVENEGSRRSPRLEYECGDSPDTDTFDYDDDDDDDDKMENEHWKIEI